MKDIYVSFKYRGLDMGIIIQSFSVDGEDETVEIEDFEIIFDYVISKDNQLASDVIAAMIHAMIDDGRHLQELIFDAISTSDMERINIECIEAWNEYWMEVELDRGVFLQEMKRDEDMI